MAQKFKTSYDLEGDVLTLYKENAQVKESLEVTEDLILDLDRNQKMVNLELLDAYKFLHTLNEKITKKMLQEVEEVEVDVKNYRNYLIITLFFRYNNQIIAEKLPAFSSTEFRSPLLASA